MTERFRDSFEINPASFEELTALAGVPKEWIPAKICDLRVSPADAVKLPDVKKATKRYAADVTAEAVDDTMHNLQLALKVKSRWYPLRRQALKTLLDRAHINGTVLTKLTAKELCALLNMCYKKYKGKNDLALILVHDQKVCAIHGGGQKDYSVLPQNELLKCLKEEVEQRFGHIEYNNGFVSHEFTIANLTLPDRRYELIGDYLQSLRNIGKDVLADKLIPGIKFVTSDSGVAGAKVCAYLYGTRIPIVAGSTICVDHRSGASVDMFREELGGLFAKYTNAVKQLSTLSEVVLNYPVNAMMAVCKKLRMPKGAALNAISLFEAITPGAATAADVYLAMHEIFADCELSQGDRFVLEENMSRALTIPWKKYDLPKVSW